MFNPIERLKIHYLHHTSTGKETLQKSSHALPMEQALVLLKKSDEMQLNNRD